MGTVYIPNQPISFIHDLDDCASPSSKYVQIAEPTDVVQFQFKVTKCDDQCTDQMDYDGATYGASWIQNLSGYCKTGVGTDILEIPLGDVGIVTQLTYVLVSVASITGSIKVWIDGIDDSEILGYITAPGTYEFYTNVQTTAGILKFDPVTEDSMVCLTTSDTAHALVCSIPTNYIVYIDDLDGNHVATVSNANRTISENYFTYSIEFNAYSITSGCYKICIVDPCLNTNQQYTANFLTDIVPTEQNSSGCGFYTDNNWVDFNFVADAPFETGTLTYTFTAPANCYNICFTISAESAGVEMQISNGTTQSGWISANGYQCVELSNYNPLLPLKLDFRSVYNDDNIYSMDVLGITMAVCSYACDCCSEPIKVGTFDCTHVVKAYCDRDALGFRFCNSYFVPQIRLQSKLVRASYKTDRESFEDSMGNKNTTYFKRRRSKNFRVDPAVAEYVHDFLSTLAGYDHMFIDNNEYFVDDDEYTVSYGTRNDIEAIVSMNVSEKVQLIENKNCGADCVENYEWQTTTKSCNC